MLASCLPSSSRRVALLHTSAAVNAGSKLSIRGEGQQKRKRTPPSDFKRDDVPHSGRTPAPERPSRLDTSDRPRPRMRDSHRPDHGSERRSWADRDRPTRLQRADLPPARPLGDRTRDTGDRRLNHADRRSNLGDHTRGDGDRRSNLGDRTSDSGDHRSNFVSRTPDSPQFPPRRVFPEGEEAEIEEGEYDHPEATDEFFHPLEPVSTATSSKSKSQVPSTRFTSPPLLPGFVSALKEVLGPNATPTPIQSLSLAHCVPPAPTETNQIPPAPEGWKQFLLASETGSGKSIAYLLPMLQGIKTAELRDAAHPPPPLSAAEAQKQRLYNPRGLVLAPTHELARQLTVMAKSLLYDVRLRVVCASRENTPSTPADTGRARAGGTAAKMAEMAAQMRGSLEGEGEIRKTAFPVGVMVGTPMKLLEMVRGRGWDHRPEEPEKELEEGEDEPKVRRGRDKVVHYGTWRAKPDLGLANVEWVVVDEADVLFDPDFQETTRTLLADISAARGYALPASATEPVPAPLALAPSQRSLSTPLVPAPVATPATKVKEVTNDLPATTPLSYPFNLMLVSATIPKSLASYLSAYHPSLVRLASPRLHRLPKALQTEYVGWTGGRKEADIVRRLRRVWAEDASGANATDDEGGEGGRRKKLSQVLVFCNRSSKVVELASHLEAQGISCVALTSRSEERSRGSNRHLHGFMRERERPRARHSPPVSSPPASATPTTLGDPKTTPHVLITTSLLSRGLDFSPDIKHVFIVDEPRNTVDFLHRAGRTARAGAWGKVVVFGKMKGRGAARGREVRRRVGELKK